MNNMRIVAGTDTGLIKVVDAVKGQVCVTIGEQTKGRGVRKLQWANDNNDSEVACLYDDSSIDFYWISTGQRRFSMASSLKNIQGMHCETISDYTRNVYACSSDGMLNIYNFPLSKYNIVQPVDDFLQNTLIEKDENSEEVKLKKLHPSLGYKVTEDVQTHKITIEPKTTELKLTGGDVSTMVAQKLDSKRMEIAIAGKDNLMKIWDVETQKCVFKAKNVPHDYLNMKQPIWDNGICYLGSCHSNEERMEQMGDAFGNLLCTRTAYHQVRFFDRRAQERPVHQHYFEDHNFTAMCPSTENVHEVVVGTAIGKMFKYHFEERRNKKLTIYRKIAGSVRDIKFHPNKKLICCVSADRYLRVYDQSSKEMLHSVYLMQRLTSMLLTKDRYVSNDEDECGEEEDEDNLFGVSMKKVQHKEDEVDEEDEEEEEPVVVKKRKQPTSSASSALKNKLKKLKQ